MRLHHVQVSMPRGAEDAQRRFYRDALGLVEVEKPASLSGRGGCWFRDIRDGDVIAEIHLGVEEPFTPAGKAHPALSVDSVDQLESVGQQLAEAGFDVSWSERNTFEGFQRFHTRDAVGNRVEVLAPIA